MAGGQRVDPPKRAFLCELGLALAAEWWARPLDAARGELPDQDGFEAVVGPAPPVYDPGGPVCLAARLDGPEALPHLERYGAAARAVLAIVPLATGREDVRAVLVARGYTLASEWYAAPIERLVAAKQQCVTWPGGSELNEGGANRRGVAHGATSSLDD